MEADQNIDMKQWRYEWTCNMEWNGATNDEAAYYNILSI